MPSYLLALNTVCNFMSQFLSVETLSGNIRQCIYISTVCQLFGQKFEIQFFEEDLIQSKAETWWFKFNETDILSFKVEKWYKHFFQNQKDTAIVKQMTHSIQK